MTLKIADGGLKISALLQAWTVADDSGQGSGTDDLGNTTGISTFRIRRAGIRLYGTVTPAWGFDVTIAPAETRTFSSGGDDEILQDLAITWLGLKGHEFSLGQKKIALTEEGLRSSSGIDLAERSRITRVLGDQRQEGLFYEGSYGSLFAARVSITGRAVRNRPGRPERRQRPRRDVQPARPCGPGRVLVPGHPLPSPRFDFRHPRAGGFSLTGAHAGATFRKRPKCQTTRSPFSPTGCRPSRARRG